ncbi:hypothetical protein L915_21960, partial [Phytophthora nicotianae]
ATERLVTASEAGAARVRWSGTTRELVTLRAEEIWLWTDDEELGINDAKAFMSSRSF